MSSKFKTLLDAQADNFDELKFYFHHLLSGDCDDDEIIESLKEMSEYGINQKILEPLTSTPVSYTHLTLPTILLV